MNELTVRSPSKVPAVRPGPKAVPDLRRYLVAEDIAQPFHGMNWLAAIPPTVYESEAKRPGMVAVIERSISACPDGADLVNLVHATKAALAEPPDRNVTLVAVGLLMDSRSRKPDSPLVFLEALVHDLMDMRVQPAVVAAACQRIRRTQTYMPEIAEVLTTCREVEASYRSFGRIAEHALKALTQAHDALAIAKRAEAERLNVRDEPLE